MKTALCDISADGQEMPRKIAAPFTKHEKFQAAALHPRLLALAKDLLDTEDTPLVLTDQAFMKPPGIGSAKPYHQVTRLLKACHRLTLTPYSSIPGQFLFRVKPGQSLPDSMARARFTSSVSEPERASILMTLTPAATAPLIGPDLLHMVPDDADESNGCLRYINGSHTDGVIPHTASNPGSYHFNAGSIRPLTLTPTLILPTAEPHNLDAPMDVVVERGGGEHLPNESFAPVKQGGVVFHHGATLHGSGPNTSDRWRRAYAIHFTTKGSTFDHPDRFHCTNGHCYQPWYAGVVARAGA